MLLINMRQIKAHYNKVIGNEIIIRQVIELGVKTKLEEGQRDGASCSCPVLAGMEPGVWELCNEDTLQRQTPTQLMKPGAGPTGLGASEQMGVQCLGH